MLGRIGAASKAEAESNRVTEELGMICCAVWQALVELQVYMKSPAMKHATANEAQAAEDMQALLQGLVHGPAPHRFTAHTAMQTPAPEISDARRLPLTW